MKKSYIAVALIILTCCFFTVLTVEAQRSKNSKQTTKNIKVVKEGVGFDGIVVGKSTMSDVKKKFGKSYTLKTHGKYSYQMIYPGGMSFYYCQTDKRQQIFDIELRAPFRAKTSKGVILSESTLQDIYRIYGKSKDGLEYRGVSFYYDNYRGKKVVTVIDIVENGGIRQCKEK